MSGERSTARTLEHRGGFGESVGAHRAGARRRRSSRVGRPVVLADARLRQYVQAVADPTATAFGGNRYVLSGLKQVSRASTRGSTSRSRRGMSFELYAQPFFATGAYYGSRSTPRRAVSERGGVRPRRGDDHRGEGRPRAGDVVHGGSGRRGPGAPFTVANPDFNVALAARQRRVPLGVPAGIAVYLVWTPVARHGADRGVRLLRRPARAVCARSRTTSSW